MPVSVQTATPPDLCCRCGYVFEVVTGSRTLRPGDFTVCFGCGELLRYEPDMRTRRTTCEDVAELTPSQVEGVSRAQAAIRARKFRPTMPKERS